MAIRDLADKKTTSTNYAKDLIMDKVIPLLKGNWMENPYFAKSMSAKELSKIQTQIEKHIKRLARIFNYEDPTETNGLLVRLSEKLVKEIDKREKKDLEKKAEKTEATKDSIDKMKEKAKIKKKVDKVKTKKPSKKKKVIKKKTVSKKKVVKKKSVAKKKKPVTKTKKKGGAKK